MSSEQARPVRLANLHKRFGNFVALKDLSLQVEAGEFLTFLGPSGCGKTTTLKIVAGLLTQESGEIYFGDRRVDILPPSRRNIGLVFQNYALFPHMTVRENIAFGLRMRKWPSAEQRERVEQMLALVRLQGMGDRKPEQLSGGQQQRVAVARALAFSPDLVLLDEPLSNLDAKLREEVRLDLRNIQRQSQQTTVFVTHDQVEALVMSDRIVLMNGGQVEQIGSPKQLYNEPATEFAARFVGANNLVGAKLEMHGGETSARTGNGGRVRLDTIAPQLANGDSIWMCVRPEHIRVMPNEARDESAGAIVQDMIFQGTTVLVDLESDAFGHLRAEIPAKEVAGIEAGQRVELALTSAHAVPYTPAL
jgi:iron(III) transport system ATP-binding protein